VVKPFSYPELLARVEALLARLTGRRRETIEAGPLVVDVTARSVYLDGERILLPGKEFELLATLARDPLPRPLEERADAAGLGLPAPASTRTLDSHASRLRRRLEGRGDDDERWIVNHWGVGYALRASAL
jgi:DNA-binding response OmpR family regulator